MKIEATKLSQYTRKHIEQVIINKNSENQHIHTVKYTNLKMYKTFIVFIPNNFPSFALYRE